MKEATKVELREIVVIDADIGLKILLRSVDLPNVSIVWSEVATAWAHLIEPGERSGR